MWLWFFKCERFIIFKMVQILICSYLAITKHVYNICKTSAQHCTNVKQMLCVCWVLIARFDFDNDVDYFPKSHRNDIITNNSQLC